MQTFSFCHGFSSKGVKAFQLDYIKKGLIKIQPL